MKLKSIVFALAAATVVNAGLVASAFAQQPIIIKFSHVVANDTPKGKAAERFKELAEKATKGRVNIHVTTTSSSVESPRKKAKPRTEPTVRR